MPPKKRKTQIKQAQGLLNIRTNYNADSSSDNLHFSELDTSFDENNLSSSQPFDHGQSNTTDLLEMSRQEYSTIGFTPTAFYGSNQFEPQMDPDDESNDSRDQIMIQTFSGDMEHLSLELSDDENDSEDRLTLQPSHIVSEATKKQSNKSLLRESLWKRSATYNQSKKRHRDSGGNGLFKIDSLFSTISLALELRNLCEECGQGSLKPMIQANDLDNAMYLQCKETWCGHVQFPQVIDTLTSANISEGTTGMVSHTIDNGGGYAELSKLISKLNLNSGISKRRFYKIRDEILKATEDVFQNHRKITSDCIFQHYADQGKLPADDGILDIAVSYDGSWLTRGRRSNFGVAFVMEADTGMVLDYEVLSKYCQRCVHLKNKYKHAPDELAAILDTHKRSKNCQQNYEGSSGGMEKQMALNIWKRSEATLAMRYTTMISDGDSSSYNALEEEKPYGAEHKIYKEECVNHVAKRLGTRLRKLKKEYTEDRFAAGSGRTYKRSLLGGADKLTDRVIEKLSTYYTNAIRRNENKTVESMRDDIFASLDHVTSSDDNPKHSLCPTDEYVDGEPNYCFYNLAIARGEEPQSHDTMRVKMVLEPAHLNKIREVYEDLSRDELLRKCLKGRTQNSNESIHSKLWKKAHKTRWYGKDTIELAAKSVSIEHNFSYADANIMKAFDFSGSTTSRIYLDGVRDRQKQRKSGWSKRKARGVNARAVPNDPDYEAGNF